MGAVPPVLLLDRVRDKIRVKHCSIRTEQAYCDWIRRFVIFHGKPHPSELGAVKVEAFLTALPIQARGMHRGDLTDGFGAIWLPFALDRKYLGAASEGGWQYVLPTGARSIDPRDGVERRHHLYDQVFQRAMKQAVLAATPRPSPPSCAA